MSLHDAALGFGSIILFELNAVWNYAERTGTVLLYIPHLRLSDARRRHLQGLRICSHLLLLTHHLLRYLVVGDGRLLLDDSDLLSI